jgi:glycosyltransferase involved in cell wall biosynthesis
MSGADGSVDRAVKVSVIVPVYNPGRYIEPCIDSLLAQTMPAEELELVFVDDGSTDETPARLDRLAAEHPQVLVIHRENSGWSGTPRNDGIEASSGEYVQFVDQDDLLGPEALERLYARAKEVDADVVIGRAVGFGRGVSATLWDRERLHATLEKDPLLNSLTPHKMLRRAFLDEHGLRFPGGRRRLEDHVFMTKAYFAATSITVLSDYVCYFHTQRDDLGNAARHTMDPVGYFANLREVIEVIEANTEPGPFRNRLLHRSLAIEMVQRARGRQLLRYPEDYRPVMLGEIRKLLLERFPPEVDRTLSPGNAVIAKLLRAGDEDALLAYARWESTLRVRATVTSMEWSDTALRLQIRCRIEVGGGPDEPAARPLLVRETGDGADGSAYVAVPPELLPEGFDPELLRLNPRVRKSLVTFRLRDAIDRARHEVPNQLVEVPVAGVAGSWTPEFELDVTVDPGARSTDSQFAPGLLDLSAEVWFAGWALTRRVEVDERAALPGAALDRPRHWLWPYRTSMGNLTFALQRRPPGAGAVPGTATLTGAKGHQPQRLDLSLSGVGRLPEEVTVALVSGSRRVELPATTVPSQSRGGVSAQVVATVPTAIPPGRWKVLVGIGDGSPDLTLASPLVTASATQRLLRAVAAARRRLLPR